MKEKITLFCLLCILAISNVHAQTIHVDTTKHTQGTTEVLIYSSDKDNNATSHSFHGTTKGHDNNVVKVGLVYWPMGVLPFYYERKLTDWFSIQGGVGFTFRDFVGDLANLIGEQGGDRTNTFTNGNDIEDAYYNYQHRKSKLGLYLSLQPKFYVKSEALEGFYVSPMFEYKRYNYKANMANENLPYNDYDIVYLPNTFTNEHRNAIDFTLNIGWQWLFSPMTLEFYMGGGIRHFSEVRQDLGLTGDPYNTGSQYVVNGVRAYSGFRPEFNLHLNLGGFF